MTILHSLSVNLLRILVTAMVALVLPGCHESESPAKPSIADANYPTNAQPRLATIPLYIGPETLTTELAVTARQQQTGMMFRTNIPEDEAMLFVYPQPQRVGFWMKNTSVPLSIAYIDRNGIIQEIYPLQPLNTNAVVSRSGQIQFMLETSQGWFQRKGISTGAVIRTDRGSLARTFFPGR